MPFDPEATGVIPKLTFPPPGEDSSAESSGGEGKAVPDAEATTAVRLPGPVHIGHPPTAEEAADPSTAGTVSMPVQPAGKEAEGREAVGEEESEEGDTSPNLRLPSSAQPAPAAKPASEAKPAPGAKPTAEAKPAAGAKPGPSTQPASGPQPATPGKPQPAGGPQPATPGKPQPAGGPQPAAPGKPQPGAAGAKPTAGGQPARGPQPTSGPQPAAPGKPQPASGPQPAGGAGAGTQPMSAHPTPKPATAPGSRPATGAGPRPATGSKGLADLVQPAPGVAPQGPSGPQPVPTPPPQQAAFQQAPPQQAPPRPQQQQQPPAKPRKAGGIGALVASAPKWLPALLVIEGLIMYVLALKVPPGPLRGVNPADIDGLGLISALPTTAFIAILIMIVSFFITVTQSSDRKFLLLFQIAAITFALHGAGALVAEEPRFPTAYIHAGFVEFIGRTGETAINIDARMGWPGFFALFAFVTKAAGITDLTPILQWTPLLSNLLYLLPFVLILRQVVATTKARWFAALLFVLVQWIGQDYFSPQGFTFALYLAFVAILLRWFGRVEPRTKPIPPKGLRKLIGKLDAMTPGELANTGTFRADKLLMLMMLVALFVASVASHQITPFMMLGVVTAFLIFKRTTLTWALPFFLGLIVLAWISYMTVGFWASQIDTIFGGLGNILQNLQSNTGDRIEGADPAHAMVLQARLGILAVILACAAVGIFRRIRRGVFDRSALILLCVPVLALGLQSYGGEIGLRIYMFALPGACLLAAYAFFPNMPADSADVREETVPLRKRNVRFNPELTKKISIVLAACFAVMFAFAFLLARYGNEKFERVTTGEVAALHYIYDHDEPSARVLYLVPKVGPEVTPTLPWGERDVEKVSFNLQALVHKDPSKVTDAVQALKEASRNSYLMVSRGQVSYLQLNEGYPKDWGERFRAALDKSADLKRVFSNDDAALYTWKTFVRGTEIPEPNPYKGRGDPTSPWTPVGIGALAVTWVALFGYEIIRLNGPNRAPRARKRLLFLAVPAFAVALAVIIERFIYIAQNN
ncbi:hypothetical protein FXF51_13055 [Nonomuraea sp. PA05]|uniref:hypothetical protein n=1 Tax=Nonomuraea sp. PA05 TaxID=2604466 RepID=UPI0011DA6149|nr:hypothetical protein [Nonomuraea sp. PA05]TYB67705.1 hypothetical protein FXF51_13055 [Nonomuraea sp. PA05]